MLKAKITIEDSEGHLEKLFSFEDKKLSNERAEYNISRIGETIEIDVTANDSVALRSVLTSITRVLTIDEKTTKVLDDE
jgi:tRNA threonylcarbamoyladenosine modification (KEOPS) complex  Pcc1 subunit